MTDGPVSDEERDRRIDAAVALDLADLAREDELPLFYLSFVDPALAEGIPESERKPGGISWLGAAFVPASSPVSAAPAAHRLGCNPGGEVAIFGPIPRETVRPEFVGRLLDRQEIEEAQA